MRKPFEDCSFKGGSTIVMFKTKDCLLVLVFFGLWLVFGKTQEHHMLLLLDHSEDSKAFGLGLWVETLSGLSVMPGFS